MLFLSKSLDNVELPVVFLTYLVSVWWIVFCNEVIPITFILRL